MDSAEKYIGAGYGVQSGAAPEIDVKSANVSEASVGYVAGNCLELAGQLKVLKKKKASKSCGWDGPFDDFEDALDAAMDAFQELYDEVRSMNVEPAAAATPEVSRGSPSTVTVISASGECLKLVIGSEQTVFDLRLKVASELGLWPCQVVLLDKLEQLLDHEVLPTTADSFTLLRRDVLAEAKAIAEELALSIRAIKHQLKTATPKMPAAVRLYRFAAGPVLQAAVVDRDFGMWAARILDGLSWEDFSEIGFYEGFDKSSKKKMDAVSSPPLILLGRALAASDGGEAAAALFVSLVDGERWCAHTVGQALQGSGKTACSNGEPGTGSMLACEFRRAIEEGCESVARDVLLACLAAAEVDSNCAAPVALAGMARAAAFACKRRVNEPEVRALAGALITSLLDALWPGRGCELKGNATATKSLVDDMVSSGLATCDPDTAVIIPEVAALLTKDAIGERLGYAARGFTLQDLVLDYKHSPGSPDRPLAWDVFE